MITNSNKILASKQSFLSLMVITPAACAPVCWGQTLYQAKRQKKEKRKQKGKEHFVRWVNWVFGPKQVPFIRPFLPVGLPNWRSFFCPCPAVCYCDTGLCHLCSCTPPTSSSFITAEWFVVLTEGDKNAPRPTVDTARPSRLKCPDQSKPSGSKCPSCISFKETRH